MTLTSILTLLQVAISLLTSAQNPNISQELRNQAVDFANQAIEVAVSNIATLSYGNTTETTPIQPMSEPVIIPAQPIQSVGSIQQSTTTPTTTPQPIVSEPIKPKIDCNFHFYKSEPFFCYNYGQSVILKKIKFRAMAFDKISYMFPFTIRDTMGNKIFYDNSMVKYKEFELDFNIELKTGKTDLFTIDENFLIANKENIKFELDGELFVSE